MKKSYLAFIALTLWAVTSQAQFVQTSLNVDTVQHSGIHDVGWIRSHSFDNWYFGIEGGSHLYYGYEDRKGSFGDRLTGQTQIHLGHWIFPMFGFRGTIGFGNSHGFISKESYLANRGMLTADYGECWGPSTATLISGSDTIKGSLGGYYWPVDDNDNLFIQKWKYLYAGIDLMVNLTYLKPFNKVDLSRRLLNLVYLGFNVRAGISEGNPEKFSNFIGYSHDFGGFKNTNFAAEGHIGYICQYELSKHLNVFGSVQLSLLEGNFDRERLDGVEPLKPDLELAVMAGLSYDFHFRSEDRRRDYYVERNMIPYNAVTLPKFVKFIQQEDLDIIRYTEVRTITYYDTIIDSVSIRQMDTIIAEWLDTIAPPIRPDTIPDDEPLDTLAAREVADDGPLSSMDRTIQEVTVNRKRRRGRHAIDYTKPVCTFDTQELYNMATDYGLSFGRFDMESFPLAVSTMLLGTYNERRFFNVRARYNDGFDVPYVFYQNFTSSIPTNVAFTSQQKITNNIKLARQDEVRMFTDFELRNEDRPIVMQNDAPDVTLEFELMPNETKRYVYRDRRVYLSGVTVPDTYYQPDYSRRPLPDNWYDYRRTLYWNPNAKPDSNGQLTISLWNNGKNSRIRVSAAGITSDGMPVCTSEAR